MKIYTVHQCDFCKNKSKSYDEIAECESKHLGLTVKERAEYIDLKERAKQWSHIVYRTNNQENRDKEEELLKQLLTLKRLIILSEIRN